MVIVFVSPTRIDIGWQRVSMDDSLVLHDVPTDYPEKSRPMPPGYVNEPLLVRELGRG